MGEISNTEPTDEWLHIKSFSGTVIADDNDDDDEYDDDDRPLPASSLVNI
jgi:hypothetical protein